MKQFFYGLVSVIVSLFVIDSAYAQTNTIKCVDPDVTAKAENIKGTYAKQGKVVFQESMLSMTSMEPTPIAVRLQQGVTYEMIFVGNSQASRMTLELFDGADKKLDHKVEKNTSHLLYTFTPTKTELYLVALTQKKGVKDMCGYFGIMVKKPAQSGPKMAPVKNAPPAKQPVKVNSSKSTVPAKTTTPVKASPAPEKATTPAKTNAIPDNQRPNPNRTRATQQYQQQQKP